MTDVLRDPEAPDNPGMSRPAFLLSNGAAGNLQQARALAQALGVAAIEFNIDLRWPSRWIAPHLLPGDWRRLPSGLRDAVAAEAPAIAIGCGRAGAWATRLLRAETGARAVQILDPRIELAHWDVVVAPSHDQLVGDNLIQTIGALNTITPARLAAAALSTPALHALPHPRTAVLIGGDAHRVRIDRAFIARLLAALDALQPADQGSVLISTSRRSDPDVLDVLDAFVRGRRGELYRAGAGTTASNPYLAFLAHADRIVVTPESVNMLSEAAATGKPTYTLRTLLDRKLLHFHRSLLEGNHLRYFDDADADWVPTALRETEAVAELVARRLRA